MTEVNEAAPVEETQTNDVVVDDVSTETNEVTATSDTENASDKPVELSAEQKALNKLAFEKREEKRRADELQRKLDEVNANATQAPAGAPVMPKESDPDIDYDQDKLNVKMTAYYKEVSRLAALETLAEHKKTETQTQAEVRRNALFTDFEKKVNDSGIKDFYTVTANLPEFDPSVRDAMMEIENAPGVIHYLSEHLDVADIIATSSPVTAAMKIGEISTRLLNTTTTNKISTAPDPIDPLNQGGASTVENKDPRLEGVVYE